MKGPHLEVRSGKSVISVRPVISCIFLSYSFEMAKYKKIKYTRNKTIRKDILYIIYNKVKIWALIGKINQGARISFE